MRKLILILLTAAIATQAGAATAPDAPTAPKTLKVGVYFEAPFVMKTADGIGGYAIDLWNQIAATQGWKSQYIVATTLPQLISMTRDGRVDVAVTDMFITAERIKQLDFSHPYYDSGLQIMI